MISISQTHQEPKDWSDSLLEYETASVYHTKEYAEFIEKWYKWKPIFFRLIDSKGKIILQNLMFEATSSRIPTSLKKIVRKIKPNIRWTYGPLSNSNDATVFFFDYLKKTKNNFYGTTHPFSNFQNILAPKTKWSTFLIDLKKPKDELFQKLEKKSARNNIKRSIERDVIVEQITDKSWIEYCNLFNDFREASGRDKVNLDALNEFWNMLKPTGFSGFLARKNEKPIGALTFSYFNNYINEWAAARTDFDTKNKLYSQDQIKWKVIEWGIENKMNWYDLSGANPTPKNEKEEGILRFKKKWGGIQHYYWMIKK